MQSDRQISTASPNDAQAVVTIFNDTRAEMTYVPTVHTKEEIKKYFTDLVTAGKIHVVKDHGEIAGFVQIS